jgi:hypothetical protein
MIRIVVILLLSVFAFLWDLRPAGAREMSFALSLSERAVVVDKASGAGWMNVAEEGYRSLREEGKPALPFRIVNILLAPGEEVDEYAFASASPKLLAQRSRVPLARPVVTADGTSGQERALFAAGEEVSAYPPVLGKYLGTGSLHGYLIASFAVFPLRYDDGTILLFEVGGSILGRFDTRAPSGT